MKINLSELETHANNVSQTVGGVKISCIVYPKELLALIRVAMTARTLTNRGIGGETPFDYIVNTTDFEALKDALKEIEG